MSKECSRALIEHDPRFSANSCDADPNARPDAGVVARDDDPSISGCSSSAVGASNIAVWLALPLLLARRVRARGRAER